MTHWFNEFCPFTEILDIQFIFKVTFLFEATAGKCWVETSGLVTSIQIFGWSNTRSGPSHSAHVSKFNKKPFLCFTFCHSIASRFLPWEDLLAFIFLKCIGVFWEINVFLILPYSKGWASVTHKNITAS